MQFIDVKLMTPNLHDLCCQLHIQELNLGDICNFLELWVEGMIQVAKKRVKGRATKHTAQVIVNDLLIGRALSMHKYKHGEMLRSVSEMKEEVAAAERADKPWGPEYDPICGVEGADCFPDKATRAKEADVKSFKKAVIKMIKDNPSSDIVQDAVDVSYLRDTPDKEIVVWIHKQASRAGLFKINSRAYVQQQSRQSFWVVANFQPKEPAAVQKYLRVQLPSEGGPPRFLRLAICQFWGHLPAWHDRDLGGPVYRFYSNSLGKVNYPVRLESIEAPLVHTKRALTPLRDEYFLTTYSHMSGHKK